MTIKPTPVEAFFAILVGCLLGFLVWAHFIADCKNLGFLPLTSLPSRCLNITTP